MNVDYDNLNRRRENAKNYKRQWLSRYMDFYHYVSPERDALNILDNYNDKGKPGNLKIYDDTAEEAAQKRAIDLHGLLLPKDRRWGMMGINPLTANRSNIPLSKLQTIAYQMSLYNFYFLEQSNLAGIVSASNLDFNCGTAAIYIDTLSDEEPFRFLSIPAITLSIEPTSDYVIDNAWFDKKLSGDQILEQFTEYNGDMKRAYQEKPYDDFIVHYGQIKMQDPVTKKWGYLSYAVPQGDEKMPLFSTWYPFKRLIIYRDNVRPGEVEGRGIALRKMATIKDLNRMVRDHRKSIAYKADPAFLFDSNWQVNKYSIKEWSGAMLPRTPGSNPLDVVGLPEMPEVFQDIMQLRNDIKQAFIVDPLGDVQSAQNMTATEASIRENRAQRTNASDTSRLINELPKQIFENCLKILAHRRMLPTIAIQLLDSSLLKFNFSSPLYDLQKQNDLNRFVQKQQIIQQFYGEGAVMATSNLPKVNEFLDDSLNLNPDLSKTESEIMQIMQNSAQAANSAQAQPEPTTSAQALPANNLSLQGVAV